MTPESQASIDQWTKLGRYVGYCYSYPHKTAYRPFDHPLPLSELWGSESQESLFLYVHIPFCEVRCGFCNLFTFSQPGVDITTLYLNALDRHADAVCAQLPNAKISRIAIGGGTPSFLNARELEQLFESIQKFKTHSQSVPTSFEVSPSTVDTEKLRILEGAGVDRVSMGIQSLNIRDIASLGRPQKQHSVYAAIEEIRRHSFPILNLDLIYGAKDQTIRSWLESVEKIAAIRPEEIYLYPLYVRPLTGLSNVGRMPSDDRPEMYREARDLLCSSDYEQVSMRMFRLKIRSVGADDISPPDYLCQRDGMIGIGCGARSYTNRCHYGSNYAVKQPSILKIIHDYNQRSLRDFSFARNGIHLNDDEARRRYLILTLLLVEGVHRSEYVENFGAQILEDFPELLTLVDNQFAVMDDQRIRLTPQGIEWSDCIGPWLYSDSVRQKMREYSWND